MAESSDLRLTVRCYRRLSLRRHCQCDGFFSDEIFRARSTICGAISMLPFSGQDDDSARCPVLAAAAAAGDQYY